MEYFRNQQFCLLMNKANKFKRRTYSHNQNLINIHPNHSSKLLNDSTNLLNTSTKLNTSQHNTSHKQNSFYHTEEAFPMHKLSTGSRRIKTEHYQIQPFSYIQNLLSLSSQPQPDQSFIKTKRLKLYPKAKSCHKQIYLYNQSVDKGRKFQTNFQILKKQIEELQSLQILRPSYDSKQNNPQILYQSQSYFKQFTQSSFEAQFGVSSQFLAKGQFNKGKNLCLLEKQRQNIKKILKNKKFRNYINPNKVQKLDSTIEKMQPSKLQKLQSSLNPLTSTMGQTPSALTTLLSFPTNLLSQTTTNLKPQQLKKSQTPQIIKKYYRPQSCSNKRNTPAHNSKNMKIELSNYISYNTLSRNSLQKGRSGNGEKSSEKSNGKTAKETAKERRQLIIVY